MTAPRWLATAITAVVIGGPLAVAASCGGGGMARSTHVDGRPPQPEPWTGSPDAARARIETLDREIAARVATLDVGAIEPGRTPVIEPRPQPMTDPPTAGGDAGSSGAGSSGAGSSRATCERSPRPLCQDVCSLSDSICDAADEICRLADQLAGDAWAAGRCSAGKDACSTARTRCCGC